MANENDAQLTEAKPKVELTISQIKEDLKNGIDRDGIKEKYGLRRVDVVRLFQNNELKGLKVHRPRPATSKSKATIGFILKDDSGNDITSTVFPAAKASTESATTESTSEQAPTESVVSEDATASSW
jgi:hypothetical protein